MSGKTLTRLLWIPALCLLAAALWFFNRPAAPSAPEASGKTPAALAEIAKDSAEAPGSAESAEETAKASAAAESAEETAEAPAAAESAEKAAEAPAGDTEPPAPAKAPEAGLPEGNAAGQRLPDFTLTQTDGAVFRLQAYRGKAVFINLWATWCDPCLREMPYFDRLQREHPEDAAVLAVHSGLILETDIPGFVSQLGYDFPFAVDESGDFTALVGGSMALPHTLVLDRNGVVIYNRPGPVTYEVLEELLALAAEK